MTQEGQHTFFSNGNLILTGEYFVLIGAKALAVPLHFGQSMKTESYNNHENTIHWETFEMGKHWFRADFSCKELEILQTNDLAKARWIRKLLQEGLKLNDGLFNHNTAYSITCNIQFNTNWGWGSSSGIILNTACWLGVDPFKLNKEVSSGSGYDIATSGSQGPIFYQLIRNKPKVDQVTFDPSFKKFIHFIYLNKKQSTNHSIETYYQSALKNKDQIPVISSLTEKIAGEENMDEFIRYIVEHENIISKTLKTDRIKDKYFSGFDGEIKSLGAWGGDFAMVISHMDKSSLKDYFKTRGLNTVFGFDEIVKNKSSEESSTTKYRPVLNHKTSI